MKPGPSPEDRDDWMATALQELIADEVKSRVVKCVSLNPGQGEKAVEQLFCAASISDQGGTRTMGYNTVEHVIFDQIRTALLGETPKH